MVVTSSDLLRLLFINQFRFEISRRLKMNSRIALFLSASLTAFVLATLAGVAGKVTSTPAAALENASSQVAAQASATLEPSPTDLPATATEAGPVDPQTAANLAAEAINRQDVYSVETSTYEGAEAYKVVFSSGDVVYIAPDGTVLTTTKLQPVVVSVPATKPPKHRTNDNNNNNNNNSSNNSAPSQPSGGGEAQGGGEHEGGD
jgi:hypothetical protein